jgi:hypothetical protein
MYVVLRDCSVACVVVNRDCFFGLGCEMRRLFGLAGCSSKFAFGRGNGCVPVVNCWIVIRRKNGDWRTS